MGRQKNTNFMTYTDCRQYVIQHCPEKTRAGFIKWRRAHPHLTFIPRQPHRVYTQEWTSWNDFMGGTMNSFEQHKARFAGKNKIVYRPYWEAVRYAQQAAKDHNLKTKGDWEEWYDSGMCPKDIPKRPYQAYEEFTGKGWSVWLGLNVQAKVQTAEQQVAVMAICQTPGHPPNMVTVVVEGRGVSALRDGWDRTIVGKPYRIYNWEKDLTPYVDRTFQQHTFNKGNNMYLVPNMNALLFELDTLLEFSIPPRYLPKYFPV